MAGTQIHTFRPHLLIYPPHKTVIAHGKLTVCDNCFIRGQDVIYIIKTGV